MKEEDNIGKFLKGRLENNEFEFDENQWSDLEKRLDASDPGTTVKDRPGNYKIAPWAIVTGVALIAFWSGWYLKPSDASEKNVLPEDTERAISGENGKVVPENTDTLNSSALLSRSENEVGSIEEGILQPQPLTVDNDVTREKELPYGKEKGYNNQALKAIHSSEELVRTELSNAARPNSQARQGDENGKTDLTTSVLTRTEALTDSMELVKYAELPLLTNIDSSIRILDSTNAFTSDLRKFKPEWSLSAYLSPEFNGTSFSTLYKGFSQAGGFTVGFQPTENLKIGLGLVIGNKIYTAGKGDYVPEKGFWTNGIEPNATEASCLALDIPLTIGYRIAGNEKRSIWVNAGLSSYWMLTENYHYVYEPTDPALVQGWNGKRENFDLFSSLNLSIAYERRIKERLFLLVEPYYKLPVGGIGQGSVNLMSSGINLGFRYRLFNGNVKPYTGSSHDP
jgi:hypothetical protein